MKFCSPAPKMSQCWTETVPKAKFWSPDTVKNEVPKPRTVIEDALPLYPMGRSATVLLEEWKVTNGHPSCLHCFPPRRPLVFISHQWDDGLRAREGRRTWGTVLVLSTALCDLQTQGVTWSPGTGRWAQLNAEDSSGISAWNHSQLCRRIQHCHLHPSCWEPSGRFQLLPFPTAPATGVPWLLWRRTTNTDHRPLEGVQRLQDAPC